VIGSHDVAVDGRAMNLVTAVIGNQEIVDSPAGVILSGLEHITPPSVSAGHVGVQIPEGIGQTTGQKLREAFALFIRKAGAPTIGGWVF